MATILDRIQEIASKEGITIGALERKIGASKGVLSRAINNGTDIQSKWIQILVENYPDYSARWLLTGKGNILAINNDDSFRNDPTYIKKFNRIFNETIYKTGLTFEQFGKYCGISPDRMKAIYMRQSEMTDTETGIMTTKLGLSPLWVMQGVGEDGFNKETFDANYNEYIEKNYAHPATQPGEGIPLIPIEAMAGALTSEQTVLEYECERYVVPMFKGADFLIPVKGSSMYPKYSSGDIVACQRVSMSDLFFQWNKVYVIDTNQGALIKRIKPGSDKDHVLIVSDNEKYDPFELPFSAIHAVALVIGVIRLE